jgi:DNA polymerase III subunit gamma/tau
LSAAGALEELATLLQQMAVEQVVPGALDSEDPDTPEVANLAHAWAADEVQLLYSIAVFGRQELQLMNDEYAALTMVLLRFLAFPVGTPGAAIKEPQPAAKKPEVKPQPATAVSKAERVTTATASVALPVTAPVGARTPLAVVSEPKRVAEPVLADPTVGTNSPNEPPPWVEAMPDDMEQAPPAPTRDTTPRVPATREALLQPTALGERWATLVGAMTQRGLISALVRELAMQSEWLAEMAGERGARWQLRVERESLRTTVLRDKLQQALAQVHGEAVELELIEGTALDSPALRDAAARARAQQQAEHVMTSDPVVRELMSQFKTARIVPGSIKPVQRNPSP